MRKKARRRAGWSVAALILLVMAMMLAVGCGEEEETTTTAAPAGTESTAPGTSETTAPETTGSETTASEAGTPVYGGTFRFISNACAQVLGYWPEQGPNDEFGIFPAVERIVTTLHRELVPDLAKSADEDPDALTLTVKLQEGVLFHDGSELTAEVAKWNYDLGTAGGKLQYADAIKEFEIVDKYTYVIHLNYWNNQLYEGLTYVPMFSKEAFEKNGGEEWARVNVVGTGPFVLEEYNRDQSIKWAKNPNYWRGEEYPYLDGIEQIIIVDATTASAMMQAGEADMWHSPDAQAQKEMMDKGFKRQAGWAGFPYFLMPNTMTESCMNDQQVREAVEYALDKPAINEAIGYGLTTPIYEVAPPGEWGSGASKIKREYDPEKAKQLLAEAGYADGCPIDLLAVAETGGRSTGAEAVKGYLDAAGFITNIDIADAGRFYGSVFGEGWKDLALMFGGVDVNYLMTISAWWGPNPKTNLASFKRPDDFIALCEDAFQARTEDEKKAKAGEIVAYMSEHALMIPLYFSPAGVILQDWTHADYPVEGGFTWWTWYDDWLDEH